MINTGLHNLSHRDQSSERELLSTLETLEDHGNVLLGHQMEAVADHKNLVHKTFNTERVMRWRLISEEFGLKLTHTKGSHNAVEDALS